MDFAYNALGQWSSITRYASLDTSELVATTGYSYDLANRLTAITHQDSTPATFAGYVSPSPKSLRILALKEVEE